MEWSVKIKLPPVVTIRCNSITSGSTCYRPRSEGNVFTGVCLSICPQEVCPRMNLGCVCHSIHLSRWYASQHAPGQGCGQVGCRQGVNTGGVDKDMRLYIPFPQTATDAVGTHPTGMHSCNYIDFQFNK